MKKLLLFLFIIICHFAHAQEEPYFPDMRSWSLYLTDTIDRYIFADTAFVRSTPNTKLTPVDTLFAGDNITVTKITTNSLAIRGIEGPWLQIKYVKNGEQKIGYVWQGLVSCEPLRRGDLKFVYAIERRVDSIRLSGKNKDTIRRYQVVLKVVQQGKILARSAILTPDDQSANFSSGKIMSGMGLTNVQNVIVLNFNGAACGVPTYDYYLAWTKTGQLVRLPDKTNIGDAGVFYHSETFTFPNEKNGKPDTIIWNMITEEATEKVDLNNEPVFKTTGKKSAEYKWDGVLGRITG